MPVATILLWIASAGLSSLDCHDTITYIFADPFPPPTDVFLTDATPGNLTFSWTSPDLNCPSIRFNLETQNCGLCQNSTSLTSTTCTNFTLPALCTVVIYSVICDNLISRNPSKLVTANLTGNN